MKLLILLLVCFMWGFDATRSELNKIVPNELPRIAIFTSLFDNKNPKMQFRSASSFIGTLQHFRRRAPDIPIFIFIDEATQMQHFICQMCICVYREDLRQVVSDFHYLHQSVNPLVYEYHCFLRWPLYSAFLQHQYGSSNTGDSSSSSSSSNGGAGATFDSSYVISLDLDIVLSLPLDQLVDEYMRVPGSNHSVVSNGGFEMFRTSELVRFGQSVADLYRDNVASRAALKEFVLQRGDHGMANNFYRKNLTIHAQITGPDGIIDARGSADSSAAAVAEAEAAAAAASERVKSGLTNSSSKLRHDALIHFSDMYLLSRIPGTVSLTGRMTECPHASIVGIANACTRDGKIFRCLHKDEETRSFDFVAEACYAHLGGVGKKHLHTFFMCLEQAMTCTPADYHQSNYFNN